jgi:hypothetical protein
MTGSVALDVVIGLLFIYLLYSLFATVLTEIIVTYIGLRARNLKEAVDRMLNDEPEYDRGFLNRTIDSFKLTKNPTNPRITNFYNHPEIKYLGSTGIFKIPSSFKALSFSKTIIYLLNETGYKKLTMADDAKMKNPDKGDIKGVPVTPVSKDLITAALEAIIEEHEDVKVDPSDKERIVLDHETAKYVFSMWHDSYGDIVKFKLHLETWFDRTMEQCLEWYKRKIQIVLLVLGFMLAWFFNADTFTIIHKLSTNNNAREQIVSMANAYVENNRDLIEKVGTDPSIDPNYNAKIDSLLDVKKKFEQDIADANTVLGLGGWPADSILVKTDPSTGKFTYLPQVDEEVVMDMKKDSIVNGEFLYFRNSGQKAEYFFRLFPLHFIGFLVTAIAISLGAPFWFDLLNKLMKLRTAVKQPIRTPQHSANTDNDGYISPLNREA